MTLLVVSWADIGMAALIVVVAVAAIFVGRLVVRLAGALLGWIILTVIGLAAIGGITVMVQGWIDAGGIPLK